MSFSTEKIDEINHEYSLVRVELRELMEQTVDAGQRVQKPDVREHLLYGVSRRLSIINRAIYIVFSQFPPESTTPIDKDSLDDIQLSLHAHVMNAYGIFDNWAWAFVLDGDLLDTVGGKHNVGVFRRNTKRQLPEALTRYIDEHDVESWHSNYLKSFRDALAHRIPLYIPPAVYTEEEGNRYKELQNSKLNLIMKSQYARLEEVKAEQQTLGSPCFYFLHSFEDEEPKRTVLHTQLICDALTIIGFGEVFMNEWINRA